MGNTSRVLHMGVNTKIRLPLHVSTDRITQFVARVAGHPIGQDSFSDHTIHRVNGRLETISTPRPFDPSLPSSKANSWHVEFVGPYDQRPHIKASEGNGLGFGSLIFRDAVGHSHSWYIHAETENEDFRELSPGCHGLAVAVGRRLVKFFGGNIQYSDAREDRPFDLRVSNTQATFPKKLKSQSSDDRWYQFHNALFSEPVLSSQELKQAIDEFGANDYHLQLLEHLVSSEKKAELERIAAAAPAPDIQAQRVAEGLSPHRKPRKI